MEQETIKSILKNKKLIVNVLEEIFKNLLV